MHPSKTMVTYPMVSALVKAEEMLGTNRSWRAVNEQQAHFLTEFFQVCREEIMSIGEIESIASWHAEDINTFLSQRGFTLQVPPLGAGTFGVASVLNVLVTWLARGEKTRVECIVDHHWYDAVQLEDGIGYARSPIHPYPIATIKTRSEDVVHITRLDHVPEGFDLIRLAEQLTPPAHQINELRRLVFPMVDVNQFVDVNWIAKMRTDTDAGTTFTISQALQQTIFTMNEQGALARSAFAHYITLGNGSINPPEMIIDAPFLLWFTRPTLEKPLFVGFIATADWKNPGWISNRERS